MLFEKIAQARASRGGARIRAIALYGFGFFVNFLGLDRQRNGARLAVDTRELRLDLLARLEDRARVLDTVATELGSPQLAFDPVAEVDDGTARIHVLHDALDDRSLGVLSDVGGERVLRQLLDAQRDTLPLRVDRQHHRLELVALGVVAHRFLTRHIPGDVGQVHQAVDVALQADKDAEVGDRLDLTGHLVATVVVLGELLPRVGIALLEAEGDAATLFVDVEHHDLDFLAGVHDLRRVDVLVGPVHFRDVHEAFDAVLDLHERAVVGDVGDLAEHAGVRRVTARDVLPRIRSELLEPEADTRALAIELQNTDIDLVADLHNLGRMFDALPGHVGDVQQAVDTAQVHERTVVGEVLD